MKAQWCGLAKRKKCGATKYLSFILNGVKYSLGDHAWLWSGTGDSKNRTNQYVAEIKDLWEDSTGVMWLEANWYLCRF